MKNLSTPATLKTVLAELRRFENVRDFNAAENTLKSVWDDFSIRPKINGLSKPYKAEFLRLCGNFLVHWSRAKGRPDLQESAKDLLSEAESLFRELNDIDNQGRCACHLALSYYYDGRYEEAYIVSSDAEVLFQPNCVSDVYLQVKISQLIALARLEKFNECVNLIQSIAERVESSENLFVQILFFNHSGYVFSHSENHDIAVKMYAKAVEICETAKDERSLSQSSNNLADALRREGHPRTAFEHICRAIALATKLGDSGFLSIFEDTKANILLALGDTEAALHNIGLTLNNLRKSGDLPTHCEAIWTKIEILLSAGQKKRAVFIFGELCELAKKHLGEKIAESYAAKLIDRLDALTASSIKISSKIKRFRCESRKVLGVPAKENKMFFVPAEFAALLGRKKDIIVCTVKEKRNPLMMKRGENEIFFLGNLKPDKLSDFGVFVLETSDGSEEIFFLESDYIEGHICAVAEYSDEALIFEEI